VKAFFYFSDGSVKIVKYLGNVRGITKTIDKHVERPHCVYFEGRLTPQEERSAVLRNQLKKWQLDCLLAVCAQQKKL